MALVAFSVGAFVGMIVLSGIVHWWRTRHGIDNLTGDVWIAVLIALAFYGLGTRELYRLDEATVYVVVGLVLWIVAYFTKLGRRKTPAP
jgi:uncharacterized membrane protein